MKAIAERPADSAGEFAALAAAVHPAWHQAIIRLANASERVAFRLEAFMGTPIDGGMARHARELVKDLIDFLDQLEADPELEDECEDEGAQCEDEGAEHDGREPDVDDEPSLGSVDPSMSGGDQTRWAAGGRRDLELDPTESGIGDHDGLLEQIGWLDWQHTVMA